MVKRCFFIILIGVISKFESISFDLGLSARIDTVGVGFEKAPVRCTSPCFHLEQSVSTVLWECTAASPGIADPPGQHLVPPHISYKNSPVVPTVASHAWFPNPAWALGQSRAAPSGVNPHPLGLGRKPWQLGQPAWLPAAAAEFSGAVSQRVEVSVPSPVECCEVLLCSLRLNGQERPRRDSRGCRRAHDTRLSESALCLPTAAPWLTQKV